MPNPEWGIKRICQSCGTKFYDLLHDPIRCPKCQTEYDPEAFLKTRRSRPPAASEKAAAPNKAVADPDAEVEEVEGVEAAEDDDAAGVEADDDEDEEDVIEDASELGEDDDDLAEVIENVDEDDER